MHTKQSWRKARRAVALACAGAFTLGSALAVPVTYVVTGVGTGSLGTATFTSAAFTLTSVADTDDIFQSREEVFRVPNATMTVSVDGLGTASFMIPTITVSNWKYGGSAGMGAPVQDDGILFVESAALAEWKLQPSIGPVAGTSTTFGVSFATSAGDFSLTAVDGTQFSAAVVPEPASAWLMALGVVALAARRRATR